MEEVAGAEGFKAAKDAKLRAGAGDRKIWSSLFVRADTVAEAVAARFGAPFALPDASVDLYRGLTVRMRCGEECFCDLDLLCPYPLCPLYPQGCPSPT